MGSSSIDIRRSPSNGSLSPRHDVEKSPAGSAYNGREGSVEALVRTDFTHRNLKPRHIQLIGIGGTIATALFIQIGNGLIGGGPGSLFLAFVIWCAFILAVTVSMAEMVSRLPISSPFIRFAGRYVDESLGFAAGWNFYLYQVALATFVSVPVFFIVYVDVNRTQEVTAVNVICKFWDNPVPTWAMIAMVIILFAVINLVAVQSYGETEFWAALGKMILITGLIIFTFITMLGGNPQHDRFGFRYWNDPGSFRERFTTGDLGRLQGFLKALITAAFTIAGPDYVSMAAGEAENPRKSMPRAYATVFYRLAVFFVLGSLAVGILVPYNDQELADALLNGKPGAAASPYVVAMNRMNIPVLPHIVNALMLSSAFSAGNSYVYCSSRSLYGMALEGKAPKIFTKCTKSGVPVYAVCLSLAITLLSFLQTNNNASKVLDWFVSLVTASQLINFFVMSLTYLGFYRAWKAQGRTRTEADRDNMPFIGWWQPYTAIFALVGTFTMVFLSGYEVFVPGNWAIDDFLFSYLAVMIFPVLIIVWKLVHRTPLHKPHEVDLDLGLAEILEYEKQYVPVPPKNAFQKWFNIIFS